jgi:hypothetical protein
MPSEVIPHALARQRFMDAVAAILGQMEQARADMARTDIQRLTDALNRGESYQVRPLSRGVIELALSKLDCNTTPEISPLGLEYLARSSRAASN